MKEKAGSDVTGALELVTGDDGSVYLGAAKGARGSFLLSVTDRYRPDSGARSCGCDSTEAEEGEVYLDRADLLRLIQHAARLLAESEA